MGWYRKNVEEPAKDFGRKLDDKIFEPIKDVGRKVDDEILQPVKNTVEAIVEDPKKLAAVALAVAFPGAGAALGSALGLGTGVVAQVAGQALINATLNGGDVKAAVIGAVLPIAGKEIAGTLSTTLTNSEITGTLNKVITRAVTQGTTAAILGKDPLSAALLGGVTAGVNAIVPDIPGYNDLPQAAKNAVSSAIATKLTGGDAGAAISESLITDAIDYAKKEVATYQKRGDAIKSLSDAGINFGEDYSGLSEEQKAVVDSVANSKNQLDAIAEYKIRQNLTPEEIDQLRVDLGLPPELRPGSGTQYAGIGVGVGLPENAVTGVGAGGRPYQFAADNLAPDEKIIGSTIRPDGSVAVQVERTNPSKPSEKITYEAIKDAATGDVFYEWGGFDIDEEGVPNFGSTVASGSKPSWTWGAEGAPGVSVESPESTPESAESPVTLEGILSGLDDGRNKNTSPANPLPAPEQPATEDAQKAVDDTAGLATSGALDTIKNELAKEIQAAKDIGLKGDEALQAGLSSLSEKMGINQAEVLKQLGTSTDALRTEFGAGLADVTDAQKAEADARAAQGEELQGAITEVAGQVTGLEGKLTAQGKAFADQLVRQGMDYKTAMQTAIDAQSALFGTQIGEVQADIAANEARRLADQKAATEAAIERERQANIRTTTARAQTGAQDIMRQLESMQKAGMAPQPAQVVESSAGFDLSNPLNTGFFSGFQSKKGQQNQQPTTKIAAGGYIDDLLAGDMTADDLLNLLR